MTGSVADELLVPNAVAMACPMFPMNFTGLFRVTKKKIVGRITKPWKMIPPATVKK